MAKFQVPGAVWRSAECQGLRERYSPPEHRWSWCALPSAPGYRADPELRVNALTQCTRFMSNHSIWTYLTASHDHVNATLFTHDYVEFFMHSISSVAGLGFRVTFSSRLEPAYPPQAEDAIGTHQYVGQASPAECHCPPPFPWARSKMVRLLNSHIEP